LTGVPTVELMRKGFWQRSHHLDRMTLRELVIAYVQYPAILAYGALAAVAIALAAWRPSGALATTVSVAIAVLVYPLVWYVLHRWVLHSRWMFKVPVLAATWKRIHYDHHQDPNHLEVLFGALHTTLPVIVLMTVPIGWALGGFGAACAALAAGLLTTCFYEFCHCIQHLAYKPRSPMLVAMKARHMAHHFFDETGNYGITNFFWDRLLGTFYDREERKVKSATVFNLGYTPEVAELYPHVARLSGGVATGHPRQRPQG
jgi:sterol desaturase/sphingolipid hydroxylase (fatty acid hydroxylase superfamily)